MMQRVLDIRADPADMAINRQMCSGFSVPIMDDLRVSTEVIGKVPARNRVAPRAVIPPQFGHGGGQSDCRRMLAAAVDVVRARQQVGSLGLGPCKGLCADCQENAGQWRSDDCEAGRFEDLGTR